MKLDIIQKAYKLDLNKIHESYQYSEVVVFAESRGQAKQQISNEIEISSFKLAFFENEMTFLNMPVRRAKQYDRVIYKGEEMRRNQVEHKLRIEKENNRIEIFLSDPKITHCFIMKRGSYYAWNYSGYVSYSHFAGVYPKLEAVPYCKNDLDLTCVAINNSEHNENILNAIERLKKGLIPTQQNK